MELPTLVISHLTVTRALAASICPCPVPCPTRRKKLRVSQTSGSAPQLRKGYPSLHNVQARHSSLARAQPTSAPIATAAPQASERDPSELLRELAGEELSYVAMAPTALGRGLVTQAPVIRQAIVSVPMHNSLCLTDEPMSGISVFGDRLQQTWQRHHGVMPVEMQEFLQGEERWDIRMTAWLLYVLDMERQKSLGGVLGADRSGSLWGQYLALLPPESEMCCLLNYTQEEGKELQLPQLVTEARIQREWSEYCHSYYFSKASGKFKFAERTQDTIWACAMVRSRTFSENVNGEGITLMVPYADLANHSFSHNATFCVGQSRQNFELRSVVHINQGIETAISYGETKCNYQLLRDYGFVVPGNPNDRIPLLPDPPRSSTSDSDNRSNDGGGSSSSSSSSSNGSSSSGSCSGAYFGNAEDTAKAVVRGHRLNGLGIVEAAGLAGDWMKGELQAQPQYAAQPQGATGVPHSQAADCAAASGSSSGGSGSGADAGGGSRRWSSQAGDCAFWSRQRSAVLSLPLTDGYGGRAGAGAAAEEEGNDLGKSLLGWMAKPITGSGAPPPRALRPDEVPAERAAVQQHIQHMQGLLQSLPTTAAEDQALLQQHKAAGACAHGPAANKPLSPRHTQAVRSRLEWKLLVGQGLEVLQAYLERLR